MFERTRETSWQGLKEEHLGEHEFQTEFNNNLAFSKLVDTKLIYKILSQFLLFHSWKQNSLLNLFHLFYDKHKSKERFIHFIINPAESSVA